MKPAHFKLFGWVALALLVLAGCTPSVSPQPPAPPAAPQAAPPAAPAAVPTAAPTATLLPPTAPAEIVLTVSGPGGEKAFSLADLEQLPAAEGQAGMKSSTGKITVPALYKGVTLQDLAAQVGGLSPELGLNVVARDGYAMTLSNDQITQGGFITYDPATGDEKKLADPLKVIVAYARDGQPLPADSDGTLRLVIISPKNNQVTDGHWSVKWVNKIELKPLGKEWSLHLDGVISDTVDRNSFQSCAATVCHQAAWTDDQAQPWTGVPLWYLVGRMDDEIKHDGPSFNRSLAELGYLVQVISSDGYSTTLDSAQVTGNNDLLVAFQVNGNPLPDKYFPLRLVGPKLQKNQLVGQVAEIKLILDPAAAALARPTVVPPTATAAAPAAPAASGDLVIFGAVSQELGLNEADLKNMKVVEISAEHPKKGKETYQGVPLNALLDLARVKPEAARLVFTAADGYAVEAELGQVRACADCLLAFTNTAGKFKLVMPGMESSLWVKDLVRIEVK